MSEASSRENTVQRKRSGIFSSLRRNHTGGKTESSAASESSTSSLHGKELNSQVGSPEHTNGFELGIQKSESHSSLRSIDSRASTKSGRFRSQLTKFKDSLTRHKTKPRKTSEIHTGYSPDVSADSIAHPSSSGTTHYHTIDQTSIGHSLATTASPISDTGSLQSGNDDRTSSVVVQTNRISQFTFPPGPVARLQQLKDVPASERESSDGSSLHREPASGRDSASSFDQQSVGRRTPSLGLDNAHSYSKRNAHSPLAHTDDVDSESDASGGPDDGVSSSQKATPRYPLYRGQSSTGVGPKKAMNDQDAKRFISMPAARVVASLEENNSKKEHDVVEMASRILVGSGTVADTRGRSGAGIAGTFYMPLPKNKDIKRFVRYFPDLSCNLESLIVTYRCALALQDKKDFPGWQGKIFITKMHVCFHGRSLGGFKRVLNLKIPLKDVTAVEKRATVGIVPCAVRVRVRNTSERPYAISSRGSVTNEDYKNSPRNLDSGFVSGTKYHDQFDFINMLSRDNCYDFLLHCWLNALRQVHEKLASNGTDTQEGFLSQSKGNDIFAFSNAVPQTEPESDSAGSEEEEEDAQPSSVRDRAVGLSIAGAPGHRQKHFEIGVPLRHATTLPLKLGEQPTFRFKQMFGGNSHAHIPEMSAPMQNASTSVEGSASNLNLKDDTTSDNSGQKIETSLKVDVGEVSDNQMNYLKTTLADKSPGGSSHESKSKSRKIPLGRDRHKRTHSAARVVHHANELKRHSRRISAGKHHTETNEIIEEVGEHETQLRGFTGVLRMVADTFTGKLAKKNPAQSMHYRVIQAFAIVAVAVMVFNTYALYMIARRYSSHLSLSGRRNADFVANDSDKNAWPNAEKAFWASIDTINVKSMWKLDFTVQGGEMIRSTYKPDDYVILNLETAFSGISEADVEELKRLVVVGSESGLYSVMYGQTEIDGAYHGQPTTARKVRILAADLERAILLARSVAEQVQDSSKDNAPQRKLTDFSAAYHLLTTLVQTSSMITESDVAHVDELWRTFDEDYAQVKT